MLIATDTRKARVHGMFRNPSTKRSEVVNPTSNKPPTISHSQGIKFLSLDGARPFVTLPGHGEAADHRQHHSPAAIPRIRCNPDHRGAARRPLSAPLGAGRDGRVRPRSG